MKSVLIMALGATMATAAGSAFAADEAATGSSAVATPTQVSFVEGERWGGGGATIYDRNCECNVPVINVPFYTVRPPAPPIRVRAPGLRISSAPVFAPSPAIYIQGPPIYVDAPPVQVAPAQVYLEAPDVHVRPSEVSVAPPEIHFTPAGPDHPDEHCCDVASPPAYSGDMAPPADTGYLAPAVPADNGYSAPASYPAAPTYSAPAATGSSSGYAQEPGERG
ncbi:hypothetical protein [Brevundimonas sp.]|uniref:hypothetical protein n=1 Tax=Brevundimonas sp. TaxID=1871086 RepID=UPI001A32A754|nr:hypothetical protein [Brevundimonas sp.]MBJ7486564.1 hypothetical protein [Brevundimonas sp.]